MNIKMNDRNNYTPAFQAKMQLRGNISLLDNKQVQKMTKIIKGMGQATDIVDIALPEKIIRQKGVINIAGFVNGALEQVSEKFENNKVFEGIMLGLDKIKKVLRKNTSNSADSQKSINELDAEKLANIIKNNEDVKSAIGKLIKHVSIEKFVSDLGDDKQSCKKLARAICDNLLTETYIKIGYIDRGLQPCDGSGNPLRRDPRLWGK